MLTHSTPTCRQLRTEQAFEQFPIKRTFSRMISLSALHAHLKEPGCSSLTSGVKPLPGSAGSLYWWPQRLQPRTGGVQGTVHGGKPPQEGAPAGKGCSSYQCRCRVAGEKQVKGRVLFTVEAHLGSGATQEGVLLVPVPVQGCGREAGVATEHGPRRLEPAHHLAFLGDPWRPSGGTHHASSVAPARPWRS